MILRTTIIAITSFAGVTLLSAQDIGGRSTLLVEQSIPAMPGLQSFAWASHGNDRLLIGGRTDGLHQRQPFAAFLASDNNTQAFVVDVSSQQVWSADLSVLPAALFEQLQSTNMSFDQRDSTLYLVGGYGYSATAADHITYPHLVAVDVPGLIGAIKAGGPVVPFFRQIGDPLFEVAGGQMRRLGDHFYLVGGQRFIGRYNPMGPNHGPGFIQQYTNAIRRFKIADDGVNLTITDAWEKVDSMALHRRDYNMLPQVFPNGEEGLTAFSGVFQYTADIPWLNTVDIVDTTHTVVPVFEQLLNQYHGAHVPLHDANDGSMYSVFFGGISRFYFDQNGTLWDDPNVPFVNTISMVERDLTGTMQEYAIGEMPGLLGASAEFIPLPDLPVFDNGVIQLDQLTSDTVLIGHIIGGIESTGANIFFVNTGTQSDATTRIFEVYLVPYVQFIPETGTDEQVLQVLVGPDGNSLEIIIDMKGSGQVNIALIDASGKLVRTLWNARSPSGIRTIHSSISDLSAGSYFIELNGQGQHAVQRFLK